MPRNPDMPCAGCGKLMWRSATSLPEGQARCRTCRVAEAQHGTRQMYRKRQCRCVKCKTWHNAECAAYRARRKSETGLAQKRRTDRVYLDARCLGCGEPVRGAIRKDRPYHRACRERLERAERKRAQAAARLASAAVGMTAHRAWVAGECAECLTYFVRHGRPSRFCSSKCAKKSRHWKIAMRDRLAIYDRDAWVCQLCAEPVDRDLMATDPLNDWAPSLDHIEPQSWALVPDHSPENLRLAHRWCNSVRGDLTYYTDADLRVA